MYNGRRLEKVMSDLLFKARERYLKWGRIPGDDIVD